MIGLKTRATDIVVLVGDLPLALNTTMEPIKQILEHVQLKALCRV